MYKLLIFTSFLSVICAVDLEKDDLAVCDWEGVKGKCVSPHRCLTSLGEREPKHPTCSEKKGEESFICCTDCELVKNASNAVLSPTSGLYWKDGRKAWDQCLQYLQELPLECRLDGFYAGISRHLDEEKQCHQYGLWAIGGAPSPGKIPPSQHPYEAVMGFGKDLESVSWLTSGTIISDRFILTSAHGHITSKGEHPLKYAALGVKNRTEDKKNWQIIGVKKVHQHPKVEERYNDLALIELETPIVFNKDVLPACLPDPSEVVNVTVASAPSWKESDMDFTTFTDTAKIVKLTQLSASECDEKITEQELPIPVFYNAFLPNGIDDNTQLCYGNKDTCLHTIGSPVVVDRYISWCVSTVVGVSAYSDTCGVSVYTRVQPYVQWITDIVWP
ncbi:putative trypsin-6 [Anticarsia gemmatalis]|uniref:putative trypsin-6 n=1 Tax=Anticarsia gemmatalis TaxID=129554 RepID=UPI003F760DF7